LIALVKYRNLYCPRIAEFLLVVQDVSLVFDVIEFLE